MFVGDGLQAASAGYTVDDDAADAVQLGGCKEWRVVEKSFGSFDRLKVLIAATSKNVDGNGWGIVAYQPYSDSLVVLQCENHEKLTQ